MKQEQVQKQIEVSDIEGRKNMRATKILLEKNIMYYENKVKELLDVENGNYEIDREKLNEIFEYRNRILDIKEKFIELKDTKEEKVVLTLEAENKIISYYGTGDFNQSELAEMFGVSQSTISRVLNKKI